MRAHLACGGAGAPLEPHIIDVRIELTPEVPPLAAPPGDLGLVLRRAAPVRGGYARRAVGEIKGDGQTPAGQRPAIQDKANPRQVQAVRVLAKPVEERFLAPAAGGVADLPPIGVEQLQAQLGRAGSCGNGEAVPSPLRLGAQRQRLLVDLRQRLQARDVGGEGELAVAHRKRRGGVDRAQPDVMPRHDGAAVQTARRRHRSRRDRKKGAALHGSVKSEVTTRPAWKRTRSSGVYRRPIGPFSRGRKSDRNILMGFCSALRCGKGRGGLARGVGWRGLTRGRWRRRRSQVSHSFFERLTRTKQGLEKKVRGPVRNRLR